MRITIAPNGDITLEVDDIAIASSFVNSLRNPPNGLAGVQEVIQGAKIYPDDIRVRDRVVRSQARVIPVLSPALQDVYEYLRSNGDEGASPTELARAFGTKLSAMDQRLRQLKKRGAVQQVSRGQWRIA